MNFIEAVTALRNRECKGIKRKNWFDGIQLEKFSDRLMINLEQYKGIVLDDCLAGDWELVNPTPKTEEVTIQGYVYPNTNEFNEGPCNPPWTPATLTYSRIIPRKVKKREEIPPECINFADRCPGDLKPDDDPRKVRYFREWEEVDG